jgi:hypothetical protein
MSRNQYRQRMRRVRWDEAGAAKKLRRVLCDKARPAGVPLVIPAGMDQSTGICGCVRRVKTVR